VVSYDIDEYATYDGGSAGEGFRVFRGNQRYWPMVTRRTFKEGQNLSRKELSRHAEVSIGDEIAMTSRVHTGHFRSPENIFAGAGGVGCIPDCFNH